MNISAVESNQNYNRIEVRLQKNLEMSSNLMNQVHAKMRKVASARSDKNVTLTSPNKVRSIVTRSQMKKKLYITPSPTAKRSAKKSKTNLNNLITHNPNLANYTHPPSDSPSTTNMAMNDIPNGCQTVHTNAKRRGMQVNNHSELSANNNNFDSITSAWNDESLS